MAIFVLMALVGSRAVAANAEAYAATYTPDGQFGAGANATKGREVDELVRVNGQMLIKVRDVAPTD